MSEFFFTIVFTTIVMYAFLIATGQYYIYETLKEIEKLLKEMKINC